MKKINFVKLFVTVLTLCSFFAAGISFAGESMSPDAVRNYNNGVNFARQGLYEQAIQAFKKSLEFDVDFTDSYYNLGSIYEHLGDYGTALRAYEEITLIEPKDYEAAYKAAGMCMKLGKSAEALKFLNTIPSTAEEYKAASVLKNKIAAANKAAAAIMNQAKAFDTLKNGDSNKFSSPTGITFDSANNLYVASYGDNTIYRVMPNGQKSIFAKSSAINGPIGLACDSKNNLYVANYNKNNILKITPAGTVSVFKSDLNKPYCLFVQNSSLYVSEQGANSVLKLAL